MHFSAPTPSWIGSLGFAARYVSATEEALVGGDLYEVADTPNEDVPSRHG